MGKPKSSDVFVVLPYLKTRKAFRLRGILFRSNDELDGLSPEQQEHLKTLFAMFFLRNELHITHMTYAYCALQENQEFNLRLIQRLREVQILINYLYATPHHSMGDPFLHSEHASMYVFQPASVYTGLIWPNDPQVDYGVENLAQELAPVDKDIDGYEGVFNGASTFWVTAGSRIYPQVPHLTLNISQDLAFDIDRYVEQRKNWAMARLLAGAVDENAEFNERIFTALEWHNRSTAQDIDETEALLDLAIAFESLLNLENNDKLTDRFRETVMILLGFVPRLDSWLEQFYNARSAIAHKGKTQHSKFYAIDWDKKRIADIYKGKDANRQPALPYRSLTVYGRRIFRLCLNAILSGAAIAEEDRLSSLFVHNQERLERICRQLGQTAVAPEKRILDVQQDVDELHEYWWPSEGQVQSETLIAAGKLAIQAYLDMKPSLSHEEETQIQEILQHLQARDTTADKKLHLFKRVSPLLRSERDSFEGSIPPYQFAQAVEALSFLLRYVTSPGFLLRTWYSGETEESEQSE